MKRILYVLCDFVIFFSTYVASSIIRAELNIILIRINVNAQFQLHTEYDRQSVNLLIHLFASAYSIFLLLSFFLPLFLSLSYLSIGPSIYFDLLPTWAKGNSKKICRKIQSIWIKIILNSKKNNLFDRLLND